MRVGNYELVTQLATGGMAETHIARSIVDDSIVVIKQLLPRHAGNAEFIEMFVDEGRVISSLRHPNIVAMKEFGFHDELPFLALEYLHGVDLRTLGRTLAMRKRGQMPIDVSLYIAVSMCAGLHHAHEARTIDGKPMDITHRDVSPQNVVVTFDGDVKLIDFGIATARGRTHETRSGALKGKIPYMAPEQVRAGATDRRTDIYAVAIVLYEMLTARRPYIGKRKRMGEFSMMMAIVNHDVVPVDAIRSDIPPTLVDVLAKAMALDPGRRYQTAAELEQALRKEAQRLDLVMSPQRLTNVMVDGLGERKRGQTNADVLALVSETEHAKTTVDEAFDPPTVDAAELSEAARQSGSMARVTDKGMPAFEADEGDAFMATAEGASARQTSAPVDKIVEPHLTRLRFTRPIEPGFRWARLLDGIEGALEIDFAAIGELQAPAVAAANAAIYGLPPEVSNIRLVAVPIALATMLDERCTVASVSCSGVCAACKGPRSAILAYDDLRHRLASGADIPCATCGTGLTEIELAPLASWATRSSMRMMVPLDVTLPPVTPPQRPSEVAVVQRRPSRAMAPVLTHKQRLPVYLGVGVMTAGIAIGIMILALRGRTTRPLPPLPAATSTATQWHDVRNDTWRIDVTGEGIDESDAANAARSLALKNYLARIESELPATIRVLAASGKDEVAVAAFETHEAARRLEMIGNEVRPKTSAVAVTTKYQVPLAAITRAVATYSETKRAWGVELINAPPSRPAGVLVRSAGKSTAVVAGDRIVSANGKPLGSLGEVTPELLAYDTLDLVIEHVERKSLKVRSVSP